MPERHEPWAVQQPSGQVDGPQGSADPPPALPHFAPPPSFTQVPSPHTWHASPKLPQAAFERPGSHTPEALQQP